MSDFSSWLFFKKASYMFFEPDILFYFGFVNIFYTVITMNFIYYRFFIHVWCQYDYRNIFLKIPHQRLNLLDWMSIFIFICITIEIQ